MADEYLENMGLVQCHLKDYDEDFNQFDLDTVLFQIDNHLDMLASHADSEDYFIAVASGLLCGLMDILWCGDFDLKKAHEIGEDKVDELIKKCAKSFGCKNDGDLKASVKFLEEMFPLPSDGNTSDFGGGFQHHLRDFAHHPTIVGLTFSLLTQFTGKSYGTDENGSFIIVSVPERKQVLIGKTVPEKIINGTIIWFFHLISDVAGSSTTAGLSGGTGIPGPILSLAKELSALPFFQNISKDDNSISLFLSKVFNGTLFAEYDKNGKILPDSVVKFDLRTELGISIQLAEQAVPVVANECMVRLFYFMRIFGTRIREENIKTIKDINHIKLDKIDSKKDPTIIRMLTIATSVFTTIDIGEAVLTQKYWLTVNYVGIGRFAMAVGEDVCVALKIRNIKEIKQLYQTVARNTYRKIDDEIYKTIGEDMRQTTDGFGITIEQTEILYNIEYYKTLHDINSTKNIPNCSKIQDLKKTWLKEWKQYMEQGFPGFVGEKDATLHWYSIKDLIKKISENEPTEPWYRLVLLEAMTFEPYYALSTEKNKRGEQVPSKKYNKLNNKIYGFKINEGDRYLEDVFTGEFCDHGYIKRLRKCYKKCERELNETLKTTIKSLAIAVPITVVATAAAGAFAPSIAVALVGSNFTGLSGAALTNACLAYLGGGAIAMGGYGMAGGTIAIVGGGAVLGVGTGGAVGGVVGMTDIAKKKNTIIQSAKLLVSVREIFLNDEHDIQYSNSVYEEYLNNIREIKQDMVNLELKADVSKGKDKRELEKQIKQDEETVKAMKIARKNLLKFNSSFQEGLNNQT